MKVAIVAELILLLTAGFGWAHTDLSAGAKVFPAASPDSSLYTKLPPVRADKKAKPLPELSSKQGCPGKSDASEYCYEVCDSEGGKKCRWLIPSQYIAHLENRKPLSESTVSKPQPLASHWSDREIAERMARNASGVCYSKPCQRVCENEPTPGWVITHHLESVWRENIQIGGPLGDGQYGEVLANGGGSGLVPASRCSRITPAAQNARQ